jgi:RNA polymerase sigma-70 factor (ECF subfamily)
MAVPHDCWPSTHLSELLALRDPQNAAGWNEFVERYRPPIVELCRRRFGGSEAPAEDVTQGILVKLFTGGIQTYDPEKGSLRAWLKTITKNAVRDYWRGEQDRLDKPKGGSTAHELLKNALDDETAEQLSDVLSDSLQRDLLQNAERLVKERVDAATWEVYRRRRAEEKASEIAASLQMKKAAVYKAVSRVKEMLREEVAMMVKQPRT